MAKITLITTGQPSTNPRLIKETEFLIAEGHDVKVIYCFYQHWAEEFDDYIINRNPDAYHFCGGHPEKAKLLYLKTRLRQKACNLLARLCKSFSIPENAISRTHIESLQMAKEYVADLYIAHNLGALPAAVKAAKFHQAKVGYDAEDMHSGQYKTHIEPDYKLNKFIEEKYFPATDYFTAASPLIGTHYQSQYPYLSPIIVNNVLSKTNLNIRQNYNGYNSLKLFWFSQTVGPERGLETVILAMSKLDKCVVLNLVGNCSAPDIGRFLALANSAGLKQSQLQFHKPVSPDDLLTFAANYDIGVASEISLTLNRDICLTNKIFTYIQAGLALISSDTKAQSKFMRQYPETGKLYAQNDAAALAKCLQGYLDDPQLLLQTRLSNYKLGQHSLNWQTESEVFKLAIDSVLV